MQIFLDCDGVLADFDRAATDLLGMPPREYEKRRGIAAFWQAIARHPDFYGTLPLMPDAMELFDAVQHLSPLILTALPRGSWAAPQAAPIPGAMPATPRCARPCIAPSLPTSAVRNMCGHLA